MQMTVGSAHCVAAPRRHRHRGKRRRLGEDLRVVERPAVREDQPEPQHEAEVADPVGEKRLQVRVDGRRPRVPEADQQVGDEADRLPAEEELDEIVAHHQHQHAEREQRDVAEEARVAGVVGHVPDRVHVHHQRHERDDQHHRRRQRVDQEADRELEVAGAHPRVDVAVEAVPGHHVAPDDERGDRGHRDAEDAEPMRQRGARGAARTGRRRWRRRAAPAPREGRDAASSSAVSPSNDRDPRRRSNRRCGTGAPGWRARSPTRPPPRSG